ncbi:MAG: hypothetical protein GX442_03685 [Candidatus Riflebacteria bacterium]|nr:hypothetical protein [Candidatus Riflebacteria bacterium]
MHTHLRHALLALLLSLLLVTGGNLPAQDLGEALRDHDPSGDVVGDSPALLQSVAPEKATATATTVRPFLIAVAADLHVCPGNLDGLERMVSRLNGMKGLDAVAICGDLNKKVATDDERDLAASLVGKLKKPVWAIVGNHDFMYKDKTGPDDKKYRGSPAEKRAKLKKFLEAFKQKAIRFSKLEGGHLLVFLPTDELSHKNLVRFSDKTLEYLKNTLAAHPNLPTIIFCHAPLLGSTVKEGGLGPVNGNAQPAEKIRSILHDNPQVFLWFAGHKHIGPSSDSFHHPCNKVDGVTVVHVPGNSTGRGIVRMLELTPDSAVVRTYDTHEKKYLKKFERVFRHAGHKPVINPPSKPDKDKNDGKKTLQQLLAELQAAVKALKELVARLF